MKNSFFFIPFFVLVLFTVVSCAVEDVNTPLVADNASGKYVYNTEENTLISLINTYRIGQGLPELIAVDFISKQAEGHNDYMISQGVLSHDFFKNRYDAIVEALVARTVSENVAFNYRTPQAALNAWIASEEHQSNLVGDYTHFGLSIRLDAEGKRYYTNIFMKN
jgi:uncharacterized protein YkwD